MLGPNFHSFIFFLLVSAVIESAYNEILGITNEKSGPMNCFCPHLVNLSLKCSFQWLQQAIFPQGFAIFTENLGHLLGFWVFLGYGNIIGSPRHAWVT